LHEVDQLVSKPYLQLLMMVLNASVQHLSQTVIQLTAKKAFTHLL